MVAAALAVLVPVPNAVAAPDVPDLNGLIDDSGPLPATVADLNGIPDLAFTTPTGLLCRKSRGQVTQNVVCTGNFPGAPAGTRSVSLVSARDQAEGPAIFLPTAPDGLRGDPGRVPELMLQMGHKVVFWDFSPAQSLICGVPPGTDMVCILKSPQRNGAAGVHGFVIGTPDSRVF